MDSFIQTSCFNTRPEWKIVSIQRFSPYNTNSIERNYLKRRAKRRRNHKKNKAEVDFILNLNDEIIPVEDKYQTFEKPKISGSFRRFIESYKPKRALITAKDLLERWKNWKHNHNLHALTYTLHMEFSIELNTGNKMKWQKSA